MLVFAFFKVHSISVLFGDNFIMYCLGISGIDFDITVYSLFIAVLINIIYKINFTSIRIVIDGQKDKLNCHCG